MHAVAIIVVGLLVSSPSSATQPVVSGHPASAVQPAPVLVASSLDRARFLEDTREEVYHENRKSVWEAVALALLPTLFYKPLAIGLAWHYCDVGEDKTYLAFLTAVPTAGFGSFYSEWYWAGAVATVGDLVGSFLLAWYFYNDHQGRNQPGGSMTLFYAGLGVSGFFWLFDMVMGPVGALYYNRKLRQRYIADELPVPPGRAVAVLPDPGLPTIGPRPRTILPFVLGYTARF